MDLPALPNITRQTLSGDVPCARCRYNLRGLACDAVCPECGLPLRQTLPPTGDRFIILNLDAATRSRTARKSWLRIAIPLGFLFVAAVGPMVIATLGLSPEGITLMFVVIAAVAALGVSEWHTHIQPLELLAVIVSEDCIVHLADNRRVIRRDQINEARVVGDDLILRGSFVGFPHTLARIPTELTGFDQLMERLREWNVL